MNIETWTDQHPKDAILIRDGVALLREEADSVVPCPWAENEEHPTQAQAHDGVPPCAECPYYRGHERAGQGQDEQEPWVGVMCAYNGE